MNTLVRSDLQALRHRAHRAFQQYEQSRDSAALDKSIAAWKELLRDPGFGETQLEFQLQCLINFGWISFLRYLLANSSDDLQSAIRCAQWASGHATEGSPYLVVSWSNLAVALDALYKRTNTPEDLNRGIEAWRRAIELSSPSMPELPDRLWKLARALTNRYYRGGGKLADLDDAIESWRQAIAVSSPATQGHAEALNNFAGLLTIRYQGSTTSAADLDEAIDAYERAVEVGSAEPRFYTYLSNLGIGRSTRYDVKGDISDLERAIVVWQQALSLVPPGSPEMAGCLNRLGMGLYRRYRRTCQIDTLQEAIGDWERTVALTDSQSPDMPGRLNSLCNGLNARYARTGSGNDIERAIRLRELALTLPMVDPERSDVLHNLGADLQERYRTAGALTDLERAVNTSQESVALTPVGAMKRPGHLATLGNALLERYDRYQKVSDLKRAIQLFEEAVQTCVEATKLPAYLNSLAIALKQLYDQTGIGTVLDQVIGTHRRTIELSSAASPDRYSYMNNLAAGLQSRYQRTGEIADLDQSIEVLEQASKECSGSNILPGVLKNLAGGFRMRHERIGRNEDLQRAKSTYELACTVGFDLSVDAGLSSAHDWLMWAFERKSWEEVHQAYSFARSASKKGLQVQISRRAKESWLRVTQGISVRAAFALAKQGDFEQAALAVEEGRARLMSEALEVDRTKLDTLRTIAPSLYEQYSQAAARLVQLEALTRNQETYLPPELDVTTEIQAARGASEAATTAIRGISGYEYFLAPSATLVAIQSAVARKEQALIYLVTTSAGSLALVITCQGVESIWLDFTEVELDAVLIKREGDQVVGGYLVGQLFARDHLAAALEEILPWLGERVMGPVATRLRAAGLTEVVLIPTGRLAAVPLHAARYVRNGATVYFLDDVTVSYTPNAGVLATLKADTVHDSSTYHLVGVGNPLPYPKPLPAANAELKIIEAMFPSGGRSALYGPAATRDALLQLIHKGTHLHFACHGIFEVGKPLLSRIELSNGEPLTLQDFLEGDARGLNAGLAVLSVCQSAISDVRELPDEFIGFPAGLLQAGAVGVAGTLWPVPDFSTTLLMVKFYELQFGLDHMPPAQALRRAQQWLRDTTNAELASYLREPAHAPICEELGQVILAGLDEAQPTIQPFCTQPLNWTPFVFVGVGDR
jgi:CHAT domain-containing protein